MWLSVVLESGGLDRNSVFYRWTCDRLGKCREGREVAKVDRGKFSDYFMRMLNRGVYLAPSPFEAMFLSASHTEADIERTLLASRASLAEVFGA